MTGRVLLNASGLKVSKPGFNVLGAGADGLQFSSDWSAFGLYMSGGYNVSWSEVASNVGRHDGFISFGRTFVTPPVVWFYKYASSGVAPLGNSGGFSIYAQQGSNPDDRKYGVTAQVGTTGITVTGFYRKTTNGTPQPSIGFNYYVFEYNL